MTLEQKISREEKIPRRSFLKKAASTIGALALSAYIGMGVGACKSPSSPDPPGKEYTVTIENRDIFTDSSVGGRVILAAGGTIQSKDNNSTFTIKTGRITSINVNVDGYINGYIMTKDDGNNIIYTLDAKGPHVHYSLGSTNERLINYLIPADFDTVLFAQCIGNDAGVDMGDGTVQRYDHSDKTVKVGALAYPDKPTPTTLDFDRRAAQIITDAADGTLYLNFIGEISDPLGDGCTHAVDNNHIFLGGVTTNGNAFQKSSFYAANVEIGTLLQDIVEEMMNTTTGVTFDAGGARSPYIAAGGVIIPEGRLAIRLVNMMPLGFKFSTSGVPSVNTAYLEGLAEMQEQQAAEAEALPGNVVPGHPGARYPADKRAEKDFRDKRIRD